MATTTTGRVAVPVVLVENSQCKKILEVRTDGTSTLSGFQRQLAVGLFTAGKLLEDLKYRGNSVSGDSRLDNFASGSSQDPRFTASCSTLPSGDRDTHQLVFVKTSSGRVLTQVHQQGTTVGDLKLLLENRVKLSASQQRLLLNGKLLGDDRTLLGSGVQPGSVLHLVLPVQGGVSSPPFQFTDVSNNDGLQFEYFNPQAPRWRTCVEGLNLEGVCDNPGCQAYKIAIIDPVGFGSFSLKTDKAHCPECHVPFMPLTCGFCDCWWLFDGRKAGLLGPEDVRGIWQEVGEDGYYGFEDAGNIVEWYSLVLSARPTSALGKALGKADLGALDECPICWEPLYSPTRCTTSCGHTFHAGCLQTWMAHMPTEGCPTCRLAVKTKDLRRTAS